ncbi:MAG: DUF962 domain-containing protein [Burkholderiaceae bacterium]|nr:DUF962 domain-containing protein [Burkholderiaceae bacterium]
MDQTKQRRIDVLMEHYDESHRHPVNELIHCVCVPAIVLSALGMLWTAHPFVAYGAVLLSLIYYFTLSLPFAVGMVVMSSIMLWLLQVTPPAAVFPGSIAVFVIAWIGQFIGHKIEGKKPSFFEDLRYLLIGPLYVLNVLYRRLNIAY